MHTSGDTVHGYRITRTLGKGGLGTTFEVVREATGESFALKELAVSTVSEWKRFELFEREAQVLARLSHPSIPRYIEHFTEETAQGPTLYLVQELVSGQSVASAIQNGGAPRNEASARHIATSRSAVQMRGQSIPCASS